MEFRELLNVIDRLLEESKVAVLASLGEDEGDNPGLRWMNATLIRGREGYLYAISAPHSHKATELKKHPQVTWMMQNKALSEIITVRGHAKVVKDPDLHARVLEAIGGELQVFWKLNSEPSDIVILETEIHEIKYNQPMKNERHSAKMERKK